LIWIKKAPFLSKERSDLTSSMLPAAWGWKVWSQSAAIDPIAEAGQKHWIKVKNRKHPAFGRVKETFA
jgi:hypothetical protein